MEQGPLGLNPELRTPPLPATHVRAGTGHRVLARNSTTDKVGPPTCEFTRYVRPRVATPSWCRPRPPGPSYARTADWCRGCDGTGRPGLRAGDPPGSWNLPAGCTPPRAATPRRSDPRPDALAQSVFPPTSASISPSNATPTSDHPA